MGRTLGPFPKAIHWCQLVQTADGDSRIADLLIQSLQERYATLVEDPAAQSAVRFLVALVVGTRNTDVAIKVEMTYGFRVADASEAGLIDSLRAAIPSPHPARIAAEETIAMVIAKQGTFRGLFGASPWQTWRQYDSSNFCDLARLFFFRLNRKMFADILSEQGLIVDEHSLERFAEEMSVITRAFSARWFNACAREQYPEEGSIRWYLGHCLGKLDLELSREHSLWREPTGNVWKRRKMLAPSLKL